jgi:hypothetical protein
LDAQLLLTEEQVETYFREGYLVVEELVPEEAIDSVVEEAKNSRW